MRGNSKGFAQVIVIIILLLLVGGAAYYFGATKGNLSLNTAFTPTKSVQPSQTTPTSKPVASLPPGWTYQGDACNVKFPIPPKKAPYYQAVNPNRVPSVTSDEGSGRFWNFTSGRGYPNILSKLLTGNVEFKQATAMYVSADEASGYISSAVTVSCFPNSGRYKDNSEMLTSLTAELDKYNSSGVQEGMQALSYKIKSSTTVTRWNKSVLDLVVTEVYGIAIEAKYTMFVTPQYIYEVKIFGGTNDSFVKETAQKIFDGLLFE